MSEAKGSKWRLVKATRALSRAAAARTPPRGAQPAHSCSLIFLLISARLF